jgi:hypothetical protein
MNLVRTVILLVVLAALAIGGWVWYQRMLEPDPIGQVVEIRGTRFVVEVADSAAERAIGLQHRASLPDKHGMLFHFAKPDRHAFWMKNTLIPLDFVWVADGTIVELTENVQPQLGVPDRELTLYQSVLPVDVVIEFPAGTVERYGLSVGQPVTLPAP